MDVGAMLIGQSDRTVVYQKPWSHNKRRMEPVKWWAERGLVHSEDPNHEGAYNTMSVREAMVRVTALNDMVKNSLAGGDGRLYADEIRETQQFIQDFVVHVIRKAQLQGDPIGNFEEAAKEAQRRRPVSKRVIWDKINK